VCVRVCVYVSVCVRAFVRVCGLCVHSQGSSENTPNSNDTHQERKKKERKKEKRCPENAPHLKGAPFQMTPQKSGSSVKPFFCDRYLCNSTDSQTQTQTQTQTQQILLRKNPMHFTFIANSPELQMIGMVDAPFPSSSEGSQYPNQRRALL